jgi:hypothetical protein
VLIALSDFTERPYKIPNQNESTDLLSFLQGEEERLAIEHLLGFELYMLFKEALEADALDPSDPEYVALPQIYVDLRDGAEYEYGDHTYKYRGWVDLIRPALFSLWIPRGTYKFTNVGHVQNAAPQQSTKIDDDQFEVESWNTFVKKVGIGYTCEHSFYGFMTANEDNYPDWLFSMPGLRNRFGL